MPIHYVCFGFEVVGVHAVCVYMQCVCTFCLRTQQWLTTACELAKGLKPESGSYKEEVS